MSNTVIHLNENSLNSELTLRNLTRLSNSENHIIVVAASKNILSSVFSVAHILVDNRADSNLIINAVKSDISNLIDSYNIEKTDEINNLIKCIETLLKGVNYTGSLSPMLLDKMLSYIDKMSALIFSEYIKTNGIANKYITPEELRLMVTEEYSNATILLQNDLQNLNVSILENINIVPGSHGISKSGRTVRTGFQAADYTASALASLLNAERLELWNIDTPFRTADPRIIPDAKLIDELSYAEASELAYFDSCLNIHPRIVDPLLYNNIPIEVYHIDINGRDLATKISSTEKINLEVVKSIAYTNDIAIVKLNGSGVGVKSGILAKITTSLHHNDINIRSVITAQTSINFIIEKQDIQLAEKIIADLDLLSICEFEVKDNVTLIAIIGHGMQNIHGISSNLFTAMANIQTNVLLSGSGASDLVSYIIVNENDEEKAIKEIHKTFFK